MVWGFFSKKPKIQPKGEFDHIMEFALEIEKKNPEALINLIRVLLRPLQSELLTSAIKSEKHRARNSIEEYKFFMPHSPYGMRMWINSPRLNTSEYLIHLNRDPVLPCPWHRDRYIGTLSFIGTDVKAAEWREDSNHKASVWLPWGIAFVHGGNHSIASGVISGEGTLKPDEVIDMNPLLDQIYCDGKNYISKSNNQEITAVDNEEHAAIFEIGRIMKRNNIIPMRLNS